MEFPKRTPEYADLSEMKEPWGITYGPVASRRLGTSLGINLLGSGQKICSFDCPYCDLGTTQLRMKDIKKDIPFPTPDEVCFQISQTLDRLLSQKTQIDALSVVGNGEPTLYPYLEELMDPLVALRNERCPNASLVVFTNGAHLDNKKTLSALNKFDERYVKCDAGNDDVLKAVNSPLIRMSVGRLTASCRKLSDLTVQSLFVKGIVDNTTPEALEDWLEIVGLLKPKNVHIMSLKFVPARTSLSKVSEETLDRIAAQLERRTRIKAVVFGS